MAFELNRHFYTFLLSCYYYFPICMALSQFLPNRTVCANHVSAIHFLIIHITTHTLLYCTAYVQVFWSLKLDLKSNKLHLHSRLLSLRFWRHIMISETNLLIYGLVSKTCTSTSTYILLPNWSYLGCSRLLFQSSSLWGQVEQLFCTAGCSGFEAQLSRPIN